MKKTIGFNLIIDVYEVQNEFFQKKFLLGLIKKIVKITKSTSVGQPLIRKISSAKYPFSGYSIIQIIKESHIAIHTWPEYNYFALDIFSCKKFNKDEIITLLKKFLNKKARFKIKFYQRIAEY